MPAVDADRTGVLVAGAGPAGLVAGITLAHYGVNVLVVDKRDRISTLSRALVISTRCMELLRSWGLEDKVRAGAADVEPCAWVTPTLASSDGTMVALGVPTAAEAALVSPTRPAWAPQDHLEPILLRRLQDAPTARVRFGTEVVGVEQDDAGVHATVVDRSGAHRVIEAAYVIGADGAHSTVRAQLGIRMDGPDNLDEYHRVEFRAPLGPVIGDRRYGLYLINHPDAACVLAPPARATAGGCRRSGGPVSPVSSTWTRRS